MHKELESRYLRHFNEKQRIGIMVVVYATGISYMIP